MGVPEMERIAVLIDRALSGADDAALAAIRHEVEVLAADFPLYAPPRPAARRAGKGARR
jgi:glycine/serine hydroxymethyltransferase